MVMLYLYYKNKTKQKTWCINVIKGSNKGDFKYMRQITSET